MVVRQTSAYKTLISYNVLYCNIFLAILMLIHLIKLFPYNEGVKINIIECLPSEGVSLFSEIVTLTCFKRTLMYRENN